MNFFRKFQGKSPLFIRLFYLWKNGIPLSSGRVYPARPRHDLLGNRASIFTGTSSGLFFGLSRRSLLIYFIITAARVEELFEKNGRK